NQVTNCAIGMAAFGNAGAGTTVFSGNLVDGMTPAANSVGAYVSTDQLGFGAGNVDVAFTGNRISRFETGIFVDESAGGAATAAASYNIVAGNSNGTGGTAAAGVMAVNNFWGCNFGPGNPGCDGVTGSFTFDPWLIDRLTVAPDPATAGVTVTLTADLTWNSDMVQPGGGTVPDGVPVDFDSAPAGTLTFTPDPGSTSAGTASADFTAAVGVQACAKVPGDVTTA